MSARPHIPFTVEVTIERRLWMQTNENLEALRAEAKALDIEVDMRWGAYRLKQEIEKRKAEIAESETPDPMGSLEQSGTIVNVGSTADPRYERRED